jgi:hypothetical protein
MKEKSVVFRVGGTSQAKDLCRVFADEQLFASNAYRLASMGCFDFLRVDAIPGHVSVETPHLRVAPGLLLRADFFDRNRHEVFGHPLLLPGSCSFRVNHEAVSPATPMP